MSDNKVVLPREVVDAIETYLSEFDKETLLITKCSPKIGWRSEFAALDKIDPLTLASALVNGYTAEATPEEKVREYYDEVYENYLAAESGSVIEAYNSGAEDAIIETLVLLGITIEGVNA